MASALGTRIPKTAFTVCFKFQVAPLHIGHAILLAGLDGEESVEKRERQGRGRRTLCHETRHRMPLNSINVSSDCLSLREGSMRQMFVA